MHVGANVTISFNLRQDPMALCRSVVTPNVTEQDVASNLLPVGLCKPRVRHYDIVALAIHTNLMSRFASVGYMITSTLFWIQQNSKLAYGPAHASEVCI